MFIKTSRYKFSQFSKKAGLFSFFARHPMATLFTGIGLGATGLAGGEYLYLTHNDEARRTVANMAAFKDFQDKISHWAAQKPIDLPSIIAGTAGLGSLGYLLGGPVGGALGAVLGLGTTSKVWQPATALYNLTSNINKINEGKYDMSVIRTIHNLMNKNSNPMEFIKFTKPEKKKSINNNNNNNNNGRKSNV